MRCQMRFDTKTGEFLGGKAEPRCSDDTVQVVVLHAVTFSVILLLRILGDCMTCSLYYNSIAFLPFVAAQFGKGWSMRRVSDYSGEATVKHPKEFIIGFRSSQVTIANLWGTMVAYVYKLRRIIRGQPAVDPNDA